MCGRFTLHLDRGRIADILGADIPETYEPDYNIGPGREVLAVADEDGLRRPRMMLWGLRTPWNFHVNARIETADTSPRFREAWVESRCALPACGFYEWYEDGLRKQPHYIRPCGEAPVFLAAIGFPASGDGEPPACVVLTTAARPPVSDIHERMPVLLDDRSLPEWLAGPIPKQTLLERAAAIPLRAHTVSQRVNNVRNNGPRLIEAVSPLADEQPMLF